MSPISEQERGNAFQKDKNSSPLAQRILDGYRVWESGDVVMIAAPTGSGKSTFIRRTLCNPILNPICSQSTTGSTILYFVNRNVLKGQLQNDIETDFQTGYQYSKVIDVWTYQELEHRLISGGRKAENELVDHFKKYVYIVLDECHYFLLDSTFNTSTCISFNFINRTFADRIRIFMSATFENIRGLIFEKYGYPERVNEYDHYLNRYSISGLDGYYYEYFVPPNYKYIKTHEINNSGDILKTVERDYNGSKWLIFVDSVKKGEIIVKQIRSSKLLNSKGVREEDVIFIHAGYKNYREVIPSAYNDKGPIFFSNNEKNDKEQYFIQTAVKRISIAKNAEQKIVICTSVLDNGVSFHDPELRNIIIVSEIREEFIQMLGRKRIDFRNAGDDEAVDLYICRQDRSYFERRYKSVSAILNSYRKYKTPIAAMGKANALSSRQKVLHDILTDKDVRLHLSNFCYTRHGRYLVNPLSIRQLLYKQSFYLWMLILLEHDREAFFDCQLEWLGMPTSNSHDGIIHSIEEVLNDFINQELFDTKQNMQLKRLLRMPLERLLKQDDPDKWKADIVDLGKGTRPLSCKRFNKMMTAECINLPYRMKQKKIKQEQTEGQKQASEAWYSLYVSNS